AYSSSGNPNLVSHNHLVTTRQIQWCRRLREKGKSLVARQILVLGGEQPALGSDHQQTRLTAENALKLFWLDLHDSSRCFDSASSCRCCPCCSRCSCCSIHTDLCAGWGYHLSACRT